MNQIVVCSTCDNVFMESESRHSCPLCGGEASATIMTLEEVLPEDQSEPAPGENEIIPETDTEVVR